MLRRGQQLFRQSGGPFRANGRKNGSGRLTFQDAKHFDRFSFGHSLQARRRFFGGHGLVDLCQLGLLLIARIHRSLFLAEFALLLALLAFCSFLFLRGGQSLLFCQDLFKFAF